MNYFPVTIMMKMDSNILQTDGHRAKPNQDFVSSKSNLLGSLKTWLFVSTF